MTVTPSPQSVVVPVEPTDAMIKAGERAAWDFDNSMPAIRAMPKAYAAMLAAAPAPSSLAGGEDDFAHDLARTLDRYGLKDAGWSDDDIADALDLVGEPSGVSQATVKAIMPMIEARLAALSPEAPAREGVCITTQSMNDAASDPEWCAKWNRDPEALTPRHEAPAEGAGEVAHWMSDLLGDDQNGGFIRDLCYTVWQAGRYGYNGGPGDWANDTLPTVQRGVEMVRAKVEGILALRDRSSALEACS